MFKFFPSFSYTIELEGAAAELDNLKGKFKNAGAVILMESKDEVSLVASSNTFEKVLFPFANDLNINLKHENNQILFTVVRAGERNAAFILFGVLSVVALAAGFRNADLVILALPVLIYAIMFMYSYLPAHPAHKKIRKLIWDLA